MKIYMTINLTIQLMFKLNWQVSLFMKSDLKIYIHWIKNKKQPSSSYFKAYFWLYLQHRVTILEIGMIIFWVAVDEEGRIHRKLHSPVMVCVIKSINTNTLEKMPGDAFLCLFLKGFQTLVQPAAHEVIPARTQAPSSLLQTSGPPESLFYGRERGNFKTVTS